MKTRDSIQECDDALMNALVLNTNPPKTPPKPKRAVPRPAKKRKK